MVQGLRRALFLALGALAATGELGAGLIQLPGDGVLCWGAMLWDWCHLEWAKEDPCLTGKRLGLLMHTCSSEQLVSLATRHCDAIICVWPCMATVLGLRAASHCVLVEEEGGKRTLEGTLVHSICLQAFSGLILHGFCEVVLLFS